MNDQQFETVCGQCLSYLLGHLTDLEREQFESHLLHCENCQQEIAELQPVLGQLHHSAEPVSVPAELKERTLQSAFQKRAPIQRSISTLGFPSNQPIENQQQPSTFAVTWRQFLSNPYGKIAVSAVAVMLIILTASFRQIYKDQQQLAAIPQFPTSSAMKVLQSYTLAPTTEHAQSGGIAYLVQHANGVELIVQVQNAAPLQGDQAYQVWLVKNGQRQNAGTFRVSELGEGVLVYAFANAKADFDTIGITQEPDAKGTSPRGPKVMGTKL